MRRITPLLFGIGCVVSYTTAGLDECIVLLRAMGAGDGVCNTPLLCWLSERIYDVCEVLFTFQHVQHMYLET